MNIISAREIVSAFGLKLQFPRKKTLKNSENNVPLSTRGARKKSFGNLKWIPLNVAIFDFVFSHEKCKPCMFSIFLNKTLYLLQ
jgi:hypothetical protein